VFGAAGLAVGFTRRRKAGASDGRRPAYAGGEEAAGRELGAVTGLIPFGATGFTMRADDRWPDDLSGPGWSEYGPPPALHPDHPSAPLPRVPAAAGRHAAPGMQTAGAPYRPQAQLARTTGAAAPAYYDAPSQPFYKPPQAYDEALARGYCESPPEGSYGPSFGNGGRAAGLDGRAAQMPRLAGEQPPVLVRQQAAEPTGDSVWLAERILAVADSQAAEITQQASSRAAEITQQASAQAAVMRRAAEWEVAELRRQACEQAAAIREAAERQAAELRSAVMTMSAELGQVAAYVTETLGKHALAPARPQARLTAIPAQQPARREAVTGRARPAAWPARPATATRSAPARPGPVMPGAGTATRPGARPAPKPSARPATRPSVQPGARPGGRQVTAMRKMVVTFVVLFAACVIFGVTEIGLRGFDFFVFRSAGTGATDNNGLQENQGPGQPGAPGVHHDVKPARSAAHHQRSEADGASPSASAKAVGSRP
jgi:hypothetical protein